MHKKLCMVTASVKYNNIPSCKQKNISLMFSVDAAVVAKISNYQKVGYLTLLLKSKKNIATK